MNINAINSLKIGKINTLNNFATNPLNFKGDLKPDTFEKNNSDTEDKYQAKLKTSPKTAFLYNPRLNKEEKEAIIKGNPDLYFSSDITSAIRQGAECWFNPHCFEWEDFIIENSNPKKRNTARKVYDMSIEINKKNLEKLKENSEKLIPLEKYILKAGFDEETYKRYLKNGYIQRFTLTDKTSGKEVGIRLIDVTNENNINAVERFKKLSAVESKYHKRMINFEKDVMVNVLELEKLGYGGARTLVKLIETGNIKGEVKRSEKPDGKKKIIAKVDVSDEKTENLLKTYRRTHCVDIKTLAESSGISIDKIEDAILSGEMDAIKESIFLGETRELHIDVNNEKNIEAFDKLLFEKKVEEQLIKNQKEEAQTENKQKSSTRMQLIWHFCPNTKNVAKRLAGQNKELSELFKKKKEIEEELKKSADDEFAREILRDALNELEQEKEVELKKFYKSLWGMAGLEEYHTAIEKTKEIMAQVEKQGINSIEDSEIKAILCNCDAGN